MQMTASRKCAMRGACVTADRWVLCSYTWWPVIEDAHKNVQDHLWTAEPDGCMNDSTFAVSNFVHLIARCLCMCMRHHVLFLSIFEVSRTQHIQTVSTNLSNKIASPRLCAQAASAKSWLIRRRSHTCLYLSALLNLYITLCKTMVSNTLHNFPLCQFQQFLDANRSTYHQ